MRATPLVLVLALASLGACESDRPDAHNLAAVTATERYAINVRTAPEEMKLAAHAGGLSANQADALRTFTDDWRQSNGGEVTVKSPEHGPDPAGAYRTANDARDFLIAQGIGASQVHIVGYEANGDGGAPIVLSFMRYVAEGPICGRAWTDLARAGANREYPEFGCAITANMAAQIAYPADLTAPRAMERSDAARREVVTERYRQGAVTSTAKDQQANGTVSNVGQ